MSNDSLNAAVREEIGKERVKKLRNKGLIPAIFYHHGEEPVNLTVQVLEFNRILRSGNKIIDLQIDKKKKKVLIRDIQFHPVTDAVMHVDFQGVQLSEMIHVSVPMKFIGTPVGVREGGLLETLMHEVEIKCMVSNVPHEIEVDVAGLDKGKGLYISDLKMEGIEFLAADDAMVVMVSAVAGSADTDAEAEAEEGDEDAAEESAEGSEE